MSRSLMTDSTTFLHSGHRPDCIDTVDKHFGYHTVQLMVRGSVELFYGTTRYEMDGPWLWPCFPGPLIRFHEWPRGQAWDHRYVAVTGPRVADWDAAGLWPRVPLQVRGDQAEGFADTLTEVIVLSHRPERRARLRAANVLERFLLDWADEWNVTDPAVPSWLPQVMAALSGPGTPDYSELAQAAHMSLTTLRRRFRQATGGSLHDYHLEARVLEARRLLGTTEDPVKVVAERLGYRDVFYFTRQFSQRVGVSPAEYRRTRQGWEDWPESPA